MAQPGGVDDLDNILDNCLDELDREEAPTAPAPQSGTSGVPADRVGEMLQSVPAQSVQAPPASSGSAPVPLDDLKRDLEEFTQTEAGKSLLASLPAGVDQAKIIDELEKLFSAVPADQMQGLFDEAFPGSFPSPGEQSRAAAAPQGGAAAAGQNNVPNGSLDQMLGMLAQGMAGVQQSGGDMPQMPGADDEIIRKLMEDLQRMGPPSGGAGDTDSFANDMMEKLMQSMLTKEVLYEPMKDLASKYPSFLEANKDKLPPSDYQNYQKQYDLYKRILARLEQEPFEAKAIMELMDEMQNYGQPPKEILDTMQMGLPPGMQGGFPPGMPGGFPPGPMPPFDPNQLPKDCIIQ